MWYTCVVLLVVTLIGEGIVNDKRRRMVTPLEPRNDIDCCDLHNVDPTLQYKENEKADTNDGQVGSNQKETRE